jgi:uncharacterized protein YhbP (UPF0306 family)
MNLRELIREYLASATTLHLATVRNGKPWVCNVWFASNDNFDLFWFSGRNRRHSEDIAKYPHVAGGITLPLTPVDPVRGIQFEGIARKITEPAEITRCERLFVNRIFSEAKLKELQASSVNPHDFYLVTPELIVLFDTVNFPTAPRQEYRPAAGISKE